MTAESKAKIERLVNLLLPAGAQHKPHKLLLVLAWAKLCYKGILADSIVYYDQALIDEFQVLFDKYKAEGDRNRPCNPFFHLRTSGVWRLIPNVGQEQALEAATSIGGPSELRRLVKGAFLEGVLSDMLHDRQLNAAFQQIAEKRLSCNKIIGESEMGNSFVAYLNTLQSTDANSLGALAEFQAQNPFFEEIRIKHELMPVICDTLLGNDREPRNVILTGHAGDGKSTLALEVIRSLDSDVPFDRRTEIPCNGVRIVVVKDLSEWSEPERDTLLAEWHRGDPSVRFLVVSNTGALLSMFCDRCQRAGKDRVTVENELLKAIDSETPGKFDFGPANFAVHNLARQNNIKLAMKVLDKMVSSTKWEDCRCCSCAVTCPILANRDILWKNKELAFQRISWLYERAHAYGGRLTIRQLSAHFAFFLTGGLDCCAARSLTAASADGIRFFNLFWGDDGEKDSHGAVHQLRAVALMQEQKFDTARSPQEARLLRDSAETPLARSDPGLADLETCLRAPVSPRPNETPEERKARESKRRRNYRRAVFFLGTPRNDVESMRAFNRFLDGFLRSPTLRAALAWREDPTLFNGNKLSASLFRVLQEEFLGLRIPEGSSTGDKLYITLVGRMPGVRRSVQPVLASCEFRQFAITLDDYGTPLICGRGRILAEAELKLPIPFLDYVHDRGNGELGRGLTTAYRNRIEAFKADLLERLSDSDNDELVLLRRGADGSLSELGVRIRDDRDGKKLEVL